MTSTQKHEIKQIIKALGTILNDIDAGERLDLHGLREEEAILIRSLLAKEISNPVKLIDEEE